MTPHTLKIYTQSQCLEMAFKALFSNPILFLRIHCSLSFPLNPIILPFTQIQHSLHFSCLYASCSFFQECSPLFLYGNPTHSTRLSQCKCTCLVNFLSIALTEHLCWDALIAPLSAPVLFRSFFELELVVYVSEITFGVQNTQGEVFLIVRHYCPSTSKRVPST